MARVFRGLLGLLALSTSAASPHYFFDPEPLNITWIDVTGGELLMGADEDDPIRAESLFHGGVNTPTHTVYVPDFTMAQTEVTNNQYLTFLNEAWSVGLIETEFHLNTSLNEDSGMTVVAKDGPFAGEILILYNAVSSSEDSVNRAYFEFNETLGENPFYLVDESKGMWPVVYVHWYGAMAFAYHYNLSLPTSAMWEKAARADFPEDNPLYLYATDDGFLDDYKCNYGNNVGHPVNVCKFIPSALGFCDLCGNVWEWMIDWYSNSYYECSPYDNPQGPDGTDEVWEDEEFLDEWEGTLYGHVTKLTRGGSYNYHSMTLQITYHRAEYPFHGNDHFGFRVAKAWGEYEPYTPEDCADDDYFEEAMVEYMDGETESTDYSVNVWMAGFLIFCCFLLVGGAYHTLYRGNRLAALLQSRKMPLRKGDVKHQDETTGLLMQSTGFKGGSVAFEGSGFEDYDVEVDVVAADDDSYEYDISSEEPQARLEEPELE